MASCCKLLSAGILCSCSCSWMCGHNVPINLQQDNCYFIFCNFLFLYEWKSVIPLKVSLENGLSCIFQAIGNILLQKCRANKTKHRQESTGLELKE